MELEQDIISTVDPYSASGDVAPAAHVAGSTSATSASAASSAAPSDATNHNQGDKSVEKVIKIEGMSCQHCVKSVTKALNAIEGCSVVEVSLENKCARVTVEPSVTDEALIAVVKEDGFEPQGVENA